jgi:hypothetical protein
MVCYALSVALSLVVLGVLLRHWLFAEQGMSLWETPEEDLLFDPGALEAIDSEIAARTTRLRSLQAGGGSGTWTARFAASCLGRRLAELKARRRRLIDDSRRWRLPVKDPTAIHLPHAQDRSRTGIQEGHP